MARSLLLIKLGGSAITSKDRPLTPRLDVLKWVAEDVRELLEDYKVVLVHGGGSFGHPVAEKYRLHEGLSESRQLLGYCEVRYWMTYLNQLLVRELLEAGAPAATLHTSSVVVAREGEIARLDASILRRFLDLGLVPIMYGDVVLDEVLGACVVSGDKLVSRLALELRPERVVLGTDVDGIYTDDPKENPRARHLETLSLSRITELMFKRPKHDVTGGMLAKLSEMGEVVRSGIEVVVGDITRPRGLLALAGKRAERFTVIVP